ncbi:hypothetical protein [Clostridium omnivorum]|uniref:Uncharacterized protein n=1 Tax=Clostridium omnivorum TaxID=1604902 RepID=A0ABQ5N5A7_9CLOT|nr:hypothetical protein [Clostridium sp. E14]GLC30309.1 hypothetical protein bsdE14_17190 [Clostridium sp. E14]
MNNKENINKRLQLTSSVKLAVVGLVLGGAGILTLFLTGWINQSVPIGTIILLAEAVLIGFGRWRWTLIVTEIMTLFIFIMGFIAPGLYDRLSHPAVISAFSGTWIQEIGLVIALVACGIAIKESKRF